MTKSLILASALAFFAVGAFAQASAPESAPKVVKTMKHKKHAKKHHHAAAKASATMAPAASK